MKLFKKALSGLSAWAIIASSLLYFGTVSGASEVKSASASINYTTDTITVTALEAWQNIPNGGYVLVSVYDVTAAWAVNLDGASVTAASSVIGDQLDATITESDSGNDVRMDLSALAAVGLNDTFVLDLDANDFVATNTYRVMVRTYDASSVLVDVTTTLVLGSDNQVNVSATVIPTLTFAITNGNVDFGELTPWTAKTAATTPTIDVTTNAVGGYDVTLTSANWALMHSNTIDTINSATADLAVAAKWYGIQAASSGGWTPTIVAPYTGLAGDNVGRLQNTAQALFGNTAPTNNDQITLTLKAKADATTPAGDYSDTLTFTVTGNF